MSSHLRLAAVVLGAGLVLATAAQAAGEHSHPAQGPAALTLNGGAKWATDAPLRRGMDGIRREMAGVLPRIHHGTLDAAGYARLASKMQGHIDFMVANCKLPPEVDAQAHVVLEQLIEGSHLMEVGPDRAAGAVRVVLALEEYGRHFEHPGWAAPKH